MGLLFFSAPLFASSPSPSPVPVSDEAGPLLEHVSRLPSGVPAAPARTLSNLEAKSLMKEFQKAQRNQLRALDHRHSIELKELKASHKARRQEWEAKEKAARREFFAEKHTGKEKQTYVKDFLERRKALSSIFKDELAARSHEQEERRKSLEEEQHSLLAEFKDQLSRGENPGEDLWPK